MAEATVRPRPGPLSPLRVSHRESGLHGGCAWARGPRTSPNRWFPARAEASISRGAVVIVRAGRPAGEGCRAAGLVRRPSGPAGGG
jgi:hypothetical protein